MVSGDAVEDWHDRDYVVQAYEEAPRLAMSGETKAILQVGNDDWPFPIPLVKNNAGWSLDTQAGKQEILNRGAHLGPATLRHWSEQVPTMPERHVPSPQGMGWVNTALSIFFAAPPCPEKTTLLP